VVVDAAGGGGLASSATRSGASVLEGVERRLATDDDLEAAGARFARQTEVVVASGGS